MSLDVIQVLLIRSKLKIRSKYGRDHISVSFICSCNSILASSSSKLGAGSGGSSCSFLTLAYASLDSRCRAINII